MPFSVELAYRPYPGSVSSVASDAIIESVQVQSSPASPPMSIHTEDLSSVAGETDGGDTPRAERGEMEDRATTTTIGHPALSPSARASPSILDITSGVIPWEDRDIPATERLELYNLWRANKDAEKRIWEMGGCKRCTDCGGKHPMPCIPKDLYMRARESGVRAAQEVKSLKKNAGRK